MSNVDFMKLYQGTLKSVVHDIGPKRLICLRQTQFMVISRYCDWFRFELWHRFRRYPSTSIVETRMIGIYSSTNCGPEFCGYFLANHYGR